MQRGAFIIFAKNMNSETYLAPRIWGTRSGTIMETEAQRHMSPVGLAEQAALLLGSGGRLPPPCGCSSPSRTWAPGDEKRHQCFGSPSLSPSSLPSSESHGRGRHTTPEAPALCSTGAPWETSQGEGSRVPPHPDGQVKEQLTCTPGASYRQKPAVLYEPWKSCCTSPF